MTIVARSSSETSSISKLGYALTFAAVASTAPLVQAWQPPVATRTICYTLESNFSVIPAENRQRLSSETASNGASVAEMTGVISHLLSQHGLNADRTSMTGDGSRLLQFFSEASEAGVDIFPNGDIVVIIRREGLNRIYEGTAKDLQKLPALLLNGGATA